MLFRSKDWIYQGVHAGVALLEGVTDIVKVKALIKAASKGLKEVITKSGKKDKDGNWTEDTIRELFKDQNYRDWETKNKKNGGVIPAVSDNRV